MANCLVDQEAQEDNKWKTAHREIRERGIWKDLWEGTKYEDMCVT